MVRFLFCLSFLMTVNTATAADEVIDTKSSEIKAVYEENTVKEAEKIDADKTQELLQEVENINAQSEKKPEIEINRTLEVPEIIMPECDDSKLLDKVTEYIHAYFDKTPNNGTLYRRKKHFILKSLDKFKAENIQNYQTVATSPISDYIADVKVNHGLTDKNLVLCKNTAQDKFAANVYLLIYPVEEGTKVRVINLAPSNQRFENTSFVYK